MKIYWYNKKKNIIGMNLRHARKRHSPSLTQEDLSQLLKQRQVSLDRYAISRIESGDRFVADYELLAIANSLAVEVGWLLEEAR